MVKFKSKVKESQLIVKAKLSPDERISVREVELFSKMFLRGFLKPIQLKSRILQYTGPQGIPLNQYIKKKLSDYEFYYIMAQIIDITRKIENNKLFLHNLVLDLRYVYVNPNTMELQFIYLPIVSNHLCVDIRGFMEEITYSSLFNETDVNDSVSQFLNLLKSTDRFAPEKLEGYISKINKQIAVQIEKRNVGQSGFITNNPAVYYQHYDRKDKENNVLLNDEATGLLEDECEETTILSGNSGMGCFGAEDGTELLESNTYIQKNVKFPYLIRVLTGEKIVLNKPVFRIGKEKSYVDYFVLNNNAISRSHADIITRGSRCFVYDHNSTNKTYINEKMLAVKMETEIFHGDILRLANEEFEFCINE